MAEEGVLLDGWINRLILDWTDVWVDRWMQRRAVIKGSQNDERLAFGMIKITVI